MSVETMIEEQLSEVPKQTSFLDYVIRGSGGKQKCTRRYIGLLAAWVLFSAIRWGLPTYSHGFTAAGRATLAVVVWASILWVTEAVPSGVTGITIPAMLLVSGALHGVANALAGFTQQAVFLALSAFIFAAVMRLSGLDKKLALFILRKLRVRTVTGASVAMYLTNCVLALIVPGAVSRSAALLPVVRGMEEFLDSSATSKRAMKGLVIQGLVYAPMISGLLLLTSGLPNLIITSIIGKDTGVSIGYGMWAEMNWVYLLMFIPTMLWMAWMFKTGKARFDLQALVSTDKVVTGGDGDTRTNRQGRTVNYQQTIIVVIFAAVAVGWAVIHSIKPGFVGLFGVFLLMLPGLIPYSWKEVLENTMWNAFLLLGGALSMTLAMSSSGLGKFLASQFAPLVAGQKWYVILIAIMVATEVLRLGMLSNVAAIALIAPILVPLGAKLGVNPIAFTLLVANIDTFAYVLPTQISAAVIAYGTETFSIRDYAKAGAVSLGIAILFSVVIVVPWYAIVGFPIWSSAGVHLIR